MKALARARIGLHELGADPVLHFLAGQALLEMDHPDEAVEDFRKAVHLDPEDAEFRSSLAYALFKACRFAEAAPVALRGRSGDAHRSSPRSDREGS